MSLGSDAPPVDGYTPGVVSTEQAMRALSARGAEGEVLWTTRIEDKKGPSSYVPIRLDDGTLMVNGQRGTYGFRPDGSQAWHLPDTQDCAYRAPVRGKDGLFYIRSSDEHLYGVRASADGAAVEWREKIGKRGTSAAPVVDASGRLYVADNDYRLHVLDSKGAEISHLDWDHLQSQEPQILSDGRLVLDGYDGWIAVVDPHAKPRGLKRLISSEEPRLVHAIHGEVMRPTGIGPDGAIYDVTDGKALRVMEPDGRTLRYEVPLQRTDMSVHVTLRADGAAYVMVGDSHLMAVDADGKQLFTWDAPRKLNWDVTLDREGTAYFTSSGPGPTVYALGADGDLKWSTDVEPGVSASLGPQDTLLVGGAMRPLHILDRSTGKMLFSTPFDLSFGEPPVLALEDGTIYATTDKEELACVRFKTSRTQQAEALASTPAGPPPEVKRSEGFVVIGGVKVPVRG